MTALSKKTGKTEWKSKGLGVTSWSSPRLVPIAEGKHLVLSGSGKIAGLDPKSGERLWEFDGISGNSTPTPIPLGDGRFLIGASEGRGETSGGNAPASNGVIQITKDTNGKFAAAFVWQAKKATSSFGSPVVHQGHAYFVATPTSLIEVAFSTASMPKPGSNATPNYRRDRLTVSKFDIVLTSHHVRGRERMSRRSP